MRSPVLALVLLIVGVFTATLALATSGDEFWSRDFYRVGVAGNVAAVVEYDGLLVIGGSLTSAGAVEVHGLATWDGNQWAELAGGVAGEVTALLVLGDDLYVGGEFTEAGGVAAANIARWDGTAWHALGPGGGPVTGLATYDGDVIALGDFSAAAGAGATQIATWDGAAWTALGDGPQVSGLGTLYAATVHDGALVVGGASIGSPPAGLAVWNGAIWSTPYPFPGNVPLGGTSYGGILTLHEYNGDLVAGGSFRSSDSDPNRRYTGIARWNGATWVGLEHGLLGYTPFGSDVHSIRSMTTLGSDLIVGGFFWQYETEGDCSSIVRWDGSAWHAMDFGVANYYLYYGECPVNATATWQGQLIIGGRFRLAGSEDSDECGNIARWDGAAWQPVDPFGLGLPLDQPVLALAWYDGALVDGAKRLTPDGWESIGGPRASEIHALLVRDDQLVVGGWFYGPPAGALNIATWDGETWNALGDGVPVEVDAIAEYEGDLYAGRHRWTGSTWVDELQTNGPVYALLVWNGDLVAAGDFDQARGVAANGIVRWDGTECHALGSGLTHYGPGSNAMSGYALTEYDGDLVVGGNFYRAGTVTTGHLARWDGVDWSLVGDDPVGSAAYDYGVFSLAACGSQLFVGGRFEVLNSDVEYIGRFDGMTWHTLGSGIEGHGSFGQNARTLVVADGALWVGGAFSLAGDRPASNISRWCDPDVLTPTAVADTPVAMMIMEASPNPFNPCTTLSFHLARSGATVLTIHDLAGRRVATVLARTLPAGDHRTTWNGQATGGRALPSGVYVARLRQATSVTTRKLVLVR